MTVRSFPNRFSGAKHVMERMEPISRSASGGADITTTALNDIITSKGNWEVQGIYIQFGDATSRSIAYGVRNGVNVIFDQNDYFWVEVLDSSIKFSTGRKKIEMDEGFYTGTELATHLTTQLDDAFSDEGITFTVAYDNVAGEFTITPSDHNIKYYSVNGQQRRIHQDSIGGHLLGLTADSAEGADVVTDTPVVGLDSDVSFFFDGANTDLDIDDQTLYTLSCDQGFFVETSTAATSITYRVNYKELP